MLLGVKVMGKKERNFFPIPFTPKHSLKYQMSWVKGRTGAKRHRSPFYPTHTGTLIRENLVWDAEAARRASASQTMFSLMKVSWWGKDRKEQKLRFLFPVLPPP